MLDGQSVASDWDMGMANLYIEHLTGTWVWPTCTLNIWLEHGYGQPVHWTSDWDMDVANLYLES